MKQHACEKKKEQVGVFCWSMDAKKAVYNGNDRALRDLVLSAPYKRNGDPPKPKISPRRREGTTTMADPSKLNHLSITHHTFPNA